MICIIGLDGSGKTTQAKMLTESLKDSGVKTLYRYGRFVPLLSRPAILIGGALLKSRSACQRDNGGYRNYVARKRMFLSQKMLAKLVEITYSVDYAAQLILKVSVPLRLGYTVVCDRYIHDTVATDMAPDLGYNTKSSLNATRRYFRLLRAPDLLVYLRIDPRDAYVRKRDIPDIEYLVERAVTYDSISDEFSAHVINAGLTIAQIHEEVLRVAKALITRVA